jgi:hypothetical protein
MMMMPVIFSLANRVSSILSNIGEDIVEQGEELGSFENENESVFDEEDTGLSPTKQFFNSDFDHHQSGEDSSLFGKENYRSSHKTYSKVSLPTSKRNETSPTHSEMSEQGGRSTRSSGPRQICNADLQMQEILDKQSEKDKKLKHQARLPLITELQKDLYVLNKKYSSLGVKWAKAEKDLVQERQKASDLKETVKALNQEMADVDKELKIAKSERALLQKKLDVAVKKLEEQRSKGKGRYVEVNNELKDVVDQKTKTILWGIVKFIQSPTEEIAAAKKLLKHGDLPKNCVGDDPQSKEDFVTTYKVHIKKSIFAKRNYVTAEFKKAYMKRMKEGLRILSVQDLLKCLQRDITTDDDLEMFQLYWEDLLCRQVGAIEWGKNIRYYSTISEAMRTDNTSRPLITCQDEAFTVLVVENALTRWKEDFENRGKENQGNKRKAGDKDKKKNNGLFTATDSGQNEWGGWNSEGLEKYIQYYQMSKAARANPKCMEVEKKCLELLRNKYGISCPDAEAQSTMEAKKKRFLKNKKGGEGEFVPVANKMVLTLCEVDDSDEENEVMEAEEV